MRDEAEEQLNTRGALPPSHPEPDEQEAPECSTTDDILVLAKAAMGRMAKKPQ